jgi:hypothetical protein
MERASKLRITSGKMLDAAIDGAQGLCDGGSGAGVDRQEQNRRQEDQDQLVPNQEQEHGLRDIGLQSAEIG